MFLLGNNVFSSAPARERKGKTQGGKRESGVVASLLAELSMSCQTVKTGKGHQEYKCGIVSLH